MKYKIVERIYGSGYKSYTVSYRETERHMQMSLTPVCVFGNEEDAKKAIEEDKKRILRNTIIYERVIECE